MASSPALLQKRREPAPTKIANAVTLLFWRRAGDEATL